MMRRFLLYVALLFCSALSDCKRKDTPEPVTKKTTKNIIYFSFGENADVVTIDSTKKLVHVKARWRSDGWELQPIIGHNGISITPAPAKQNYSQPQKFTITAEDGSTSEYTVIISSAWANYVDVQSAQRAPIYTHDGGYHNVLEASEEVPSPGNKILKIRQGGSVANYTNSNNLHFSNMLIVPMVGGTYAQTHRFNTRRRYPYLFPEATCFFTLFQGNSTSSNYTPESGSIQISRYDRTYNMVSGNFKEIKFLNNSSNAEYPHRLSRGEFINILIK